MDGIVKLSSLGDIIHSLIVPPLLVEFKGRQISWVVDNDFREILEDNPYISQIIPVRLREAKRKKDWQLLTEEVDKLRKFKFPVVYDLQGLLKSGVITFFISQWKGGERIGQTPARERIAELFYTQKVPVRADWVAAERYMAVAGVYDREFLLNHPPLVGYKYYPFPELSPGKKSVAFIIGSTWECRKLPIETWWEIGRGLKGWNIIIPYYGEEEKKYGERILEKVEGTLVNYPLGKLKALLSKVDLIIGHDTGPVFIGWANNIPNIILYTCTYRNKILENRYTRSVEVQQGQVDRNLRNSHLLEAKAVLREVDDLTYTGVL
jgi:heptosyltransferase-1